MKSRTSFAMTQCGLTMASAGVQGETPVQIPVVVEGSLLQLAGYMRHDVLHEPAVALDALDRHIRIDGVVLVARLGNQADAD
jgi:hypothetical protein